jgi:formate hydrogenlyase regulatory protein HycA
MTIPERIPIERIKDYHTHYIGKTKDGIQFFGYQFRVFPKGFIFPEGVVGTERTKYFKEYVVLFLFDGEGNHIRTDHWYAGTVSETNDSIMTERLEQMISSLGQIELGDIEVKPFEITIDGYKFGLIPNEEYKTIDLEPGSQISFHEPWDGEYDT